jgi:L-lactate dehydrogenase complex protein LldG
VSNYDEIIDFVKNNYDTKKRFITTIFALAENSTLWVTIDLLGQRVAPIITQYLVIIVQKRNSCNIVLSI